MKCPKCKKEVKKLFNIVSGVKVYEVRLNYNDNVGYTESDFNPDCIVNDYNCPECDATLFTNESDVIDFMEGE